LATYAFRDFDNVILINICGNSSRKDIARAADPTFIAKAKAMLGREDDPMWFCRRPERRTASPVAGCAVLP
jgi:hypothetical protein